MKLVAEKTWMDPMLPRRALLYFAISRLCFVAAALILFASALAFAQEPAAAPVLLQDDFAQLARVLLESITAGNWGLVAAAAVVLVIYLVRRFGKAVWPASSKVLDQPVVAWALPSVAAVLAAIISAMVGGVPISVGLVLKATLEGLAANGLFVGAKKVAEAKAAGQVAADAVDSPKAAIDAFNKP